MNFIFICLLTTCIPEAAKYLEFILIDSFDFAVTSEIQSKMVEQSNNSIIISGEIHLCDITINYFSLRSSVTKLYSMQTVND